jgi:hypothetical protein
LRGRGLRHRTSLRPVRRLSAHDGSFASVLTQTIRAQVGRLAQRRTLFLDDPHDRGVAAEMQGDGAVLGHGFGNIYAITSRPDATTVRAVNLLKGRPAEQVGSITTTPTRLPDAFDWSRLPLGLSRSHALDVVDALLILGPCGFRGPAAAGLPSHLTQRDANMLTTQVINPSYACLSNAVAEALRLTGGDYLYVTSANRSRHTTGAAEEPPHHNYTRRHASTGSRAARLPFRRRSPAGPAPALPRRRPGTPLTGPAPSTPRRTHQSGRQRAPTAPDSHN